MKFLCVLCQVFQHHFVIFIFKFIASKFGGVKDKERDRKTSKCINVDLTDSKNGARVTHLMMMTNFSQFSERFRRFFCVVSKCVFGLSKNHLSDYFVFI